MKNLLLLVLAMLYSPLIVFSQNTEIGVQIGASTYEGDVHCRSYENVSLLDVAKPSYGLHVRQPISKILAARLNFVYANLNGDDARLVTGGHGNRKFSFTNNLYELSALLEIEPFGGKRYEGNVFHKILSPYLFGGVGVAFNNPKVDFNNSRTPEINKDINEVESTLLVLPFGLGLRYDVSKKFNLGIEGAMRYPTSDFLDGISYSANPDKDDYYATLHLIGSVKMGKIDLDKDGVEDSVDRCPAVPGLVELEGCPDSDGDGIADMDDSCPAIAGTLSANGCPDRDNDGVLDDDDLCPDLAGDIELKGCPDSDDDGLTDNEDNCPFHAGLKKNGGCPDTDEDGIIDDEDDCPDTPGVASENGCPEIEEVVEEEKLPINNNYQFYSEGAETTGTTTKYVEGTYSVPPVATSENVIIRTYSDPVTSSPVVTTSYPVSTGEYITSGTVYESDYTISSENYTTQYNYTTNIESVPDSELLGYASQNIHFYPGTSKLTRTSKKILDRLAIYLRDNGLSVKIDGYTDSVGHRADNLELSKDRAQSCYNYLQRSGVNGCNMTYDGFGEQNPVASNKFKEGRKKNRRVEFSVQ